MSLGRAQTFSSPGGNNKAGRLPQRANTTMARSATMKPENQSPHGALVARFNNVLKHFAKIDPEDIDGKESGFGHATAIIDQAWEDKQANLAVQFSGHLLEREILHLAVDSLAPDSPPELVLESLKLIAASIFIPEIRKFICKQDNLQAVVSCFDHYVRSKNFEFRSAALEVLAACVKESDEVISKLIRLKAFDIVATALERIDEPAVARLAAQYYSFSALASNTKHSIHERMSKLGVHHYLSIIQASSVDFAVFHASLALAVLASNKEPSINITFQNPLANEFLQTHHDFFKCESFQLENSKRIAYGIAPPILERVNQLLYSNNGTIQAIGAFFLLQEVLARKAMRQFDVFSDTNNIAALKKCAASTLSGYARELASNCLRIMDIPIPVKLCPQVHMWDTDDVATWFEINGFKDFAATAVESCCDGRMLLLLNEDDLVQVFLMSNKFHRRKFIQDLVELRINGDYTSEDASGIQKWLSGIGREFSQYTFHLIQAGVDRDFLPHLTDEHLKVDCQITNGVHRTKILEAVRRDKDANGHDDVQDPKDVFVCSWKEGQLLSESLCAYLRLRSFSVATNWGLIPKSDEVTLRHESNIAHAGHFLLVLTPGCLENLIQNACEDENTLALDPFYRWIVTAFAKGCNIIPMVAPGWKWPVPDSVPEAIRDLCFMNGVRWRWGYQEEIINRLQRFMTDHGSLQSLTSVNRAQSKMSMASTTHGEYVLPTPAENLSRQPSQRSITSVTSRPSLRSFGGSPQADTGSQRSRHSSRASVASQQSINEVPEEAADLQNGSSPAGSPDKQPLRSSSRASSQASLSFRGSKPPLPPSRSNSNVSLSSSASQRYSRLADNTLGRASSRNSVASNRLSTASLPRPDMLRASSRSSVASGRSSVASDKPVPPPKPQSLSRASSRASLPPNSPNNDTLGSPVPASPTSLSERSTSQIFENVIQETVLDKDPPQGIPQKEDEKMSVDELSSGNSAAMVTTQAAVEPSPESLPSSPEPEPVSKKSVNVPVEYESTEPSPEPISDPEIVIDDHLQPVASSKDATDPDDEPLDMLISKVEKDLKVQSALPIEDDLPKDESPLPSPEKVPEKAESSLTAASLESASPPNTPDKKKSPQSSPKSTTNQSNDTPPIVIDDSDEDDGENNDESLSEDAMTTVTELTMSSTISSASAKLKKGISKRLGKAKTKTSKAFSKGLKGLKNSSEKLKSSLKRGDKKKADKGNEEEKEELEDISDEKETNSPPEVIEKTSGDNDKIEVEVVVEEKAEETAPETEPDSGVIIEKESAVLDTVVEETEIVVEKQDQPVSETKEIPKSDESKDEPEKEDSSKIEPASDSVEKAPVTEAETVEVSDEPEKSEPSETSSVPSEQVSVEPDSVKDSALEIEAPKEPETSAESSSVSESAPAPEISSEPASKEPENSKEPESEEKSEPTVAQALAQDFLTSESAEPTEPVEPAEPETEPSSATAKQNNTPKKGGKKKNKKRKK